MFTAQNESFIRWQEVTRVQFGTVNNLVLALATALLAFHSTLLLDKKLTDNCAFYFAIAALFFLAISVIFGLSCSISRLCDFRITAQIALRRKKQNVSSLRKTSRFLGRLTWRMFWAQIIFFGLGTAGSALSVLTQIRFS